MPDDMEKAPEDRRWRSAQTFQGFLDHMEEFRRSPQCQQLQADQQAAEADLADRRVFVLDDAAWTDLQALLDRPPSPKPELARLLANPSILER